MNGIFGGVNRGGRGNLGRWIIGGGMNFGGHTFGKNGIFGGIIGSIFFFAPHA
jgi:hypothetical protein